MAEDAPGGIGINLRTQGQKLRASVLRCSLPCNCLMNRPVNGMWISGSFPEKLRNNPGDAGGGSSATSGDEGSAVATPWRAASWASDAAVALPSFTPTPAYAHFSSRLAPSTTQISWKASLSVNFR